MARASLPASGHPAPLHRAAADQQGRRGGGLRVGTATIFHSFQTLNPGDADVKFQQSDVLPSIGFVYSPAPNNDQIWMIGVARNMAARWGMSPGIGPVRILGNDARSRLHADGFDDVLIGAGPGGLATAGLTA